tara:strand:- start:971 stop:1540 length:570 start_codon:yes stop_codon:yes gene_type:complete
MRIIGGKLKGSSLYISKNSNTRPLKDLVRESIFNLLIHSNKILFKFEKVDVLDLYSGTGSFGLECLSREANSICFIENSKETIKILKKNIEKLNLENKTKIFVGNVFQEIEKREVSRSQFNLIFCDPPFKDIDIEQLIRKIIEKKLLKKNGVIVLHRNKASKENFSNKFKIIDERIYGVSKIIFGQLST